MCLDMEGSSELENDCNDHAIETQYLSEDENEDERDENLLIQTIALHALLSNQADCIASCQLTESAAEASTESTA